MMSDLGGGRVVMSDPGGGLFSMLPQSFNAIG